MVEITKDEMIERLADSVCPVDAFGDLIVGQVEIAALFGVELSTVHKWRQRGFPEPAGRISGTPWWQLSKVLEWGRVTGRVGGE